MTHRLPMALAPSNCHGLCGLFKDTGMCEEIKKLGFRVVNLQWQIHLLMFWLALKPCENYRSSTDVFGPTWFITHLFRWVFLIFCAEPSNIKVAINSITGVVPILVKSFESDDLLGVVALPLRILWRKIYCDAFSESRWQGFVLEKTAEDGAPIIAGSGVDDKKFRPAKKRNFSASNNNQL